jgi:hypothetical protein
MLEEISEQLGYQGEINDDNFEEISKEFDRRIKELD